MSTPRDKFINPDFAEAVGENAETLEAFVSRVDIKKLLKVGFVVWGMFLVSIFSLIVTVRLALLIF